MKHWQYLHPIAHWPVAACRGCLSVFRRLMLSARAWVLLLVSLIVLLIAYYALSNRHTPFTTDAYVQAYVVQVAAQVEGQVVRVYVGENQPVKKGELLFEIDPRPFEHKVAVLEAKHAQAVQLVAQLGSDLAVARAEEARIAAELAYARKVFEQEEAIYKQKSTTERRYLDAVQKFKASEALAAKSQATARKAEQALAARVRDVHAAVAQAKAELAESQLNLEWTKVSAPATGYVTNVHLRTGSYVYAGKPVLTCIDGEQWWVIANFRENCLERICPGQPVGLTFNSLPGQVFPGAVESIGWGVGEGQGVPSGELPLIRDPRQWIRQAQRFQVRVQPQLPAGFPLRVGATAGVTVYTADDHWLNPVARCWQQVMAWFDYLY